MKIRLSEIAQAVGGELIGIDKIINRVITDSREVSLSEGGAEGVLFAAIRGERADGHSFVEQIISSGGTALVDRQEYAKAGTVLVKNVKKAVGDLAAYYRQHKLNEKLLVFITGSVGKTTTKCMTAAAFSSWKVHKTKGNMNSLLGLPLTLFSTPDDAEAIILEAGMNQPGEIDRLASIARPDIVVITNIGTAHIENLGSVENILAEKLSAAKYLRDGGTLVLNGDDKRLAASANENYKTVLCSCKNSEADCFADQIAYNDGTSVFTIHAGDFTSVASIPAAGEHNIQNALLAFAAANAAGVEKGAIIEGLKCFSPDGNRQRIYKHDGFTVIADCYNASPESMNAALTVLSMFEGRKIAVLGDMLELGERAPELHRELGKNARKHGVDIVVAIGDFAGFIREGFGGCEVFEIEEKDKAAEFINSILADGDTVLFKASNRLDFAGLIKSIPKIN